MKLAPDLAKLPFEKAQSQLRNYSIASIVAGAIGLFIFPVLGAAAIGMGIRAVLLTRHKANKSSVNLLKYRTLQIIGIILGLFDIVYMVARL